VHGLLHFNFLKTTRIIPVILSILNIQNLKIIMKSLSIFTLLLSVSFCSTLSAQQSISGSFSSNGNTRAYLGAIPDNPEPNMRLVLLFCGLMETAANMAERHFNDYLGNNTMVIYPEPVSWLSSFDATLNDPQMVEDLISHINSNYSIDLNDICIGGVSNGGIFTYDLVCEYNSTTSTRPYRFKAFAVVAGGMLASDLNVDSCNIAQEVPLIAFHGTADPTFFYEGNSYYYNGHDTAWIYDAPTEDVVEFWARTINGCDSNPSVTPLPDLIIEPQEPSTVELIEYDCDNCSNTQLYKINNGWHTWPTSDAPRDNLYGGHNQDIIASQLIAEFFECTPAVVSTTDVNLDPGSVSVYPNPVVDELSIQVDGDLKMVELYSPTGKKVLSNVAPDYTISLGHLPSGIYFLSVQTDAGTVMKKIIKN
jgi:poly(3-hydroxybutyrate) depolymerase